MIEPEMAFADLEADMACAEAYIKHCISYVLENCKEDMQFFDGVVEKVPSFACSEPSAPLACSGDSGVGPQERRLVGPFCPIGVKHRAGGGLAGSPQAPARRGGQALPDDHLHGGHRHPYKVRREV